MEYIEYSDNAYQTTVNLKEYADDQEFKLVVNGQWIGSGELSAIEGNEASCVIEGEFMGNNLNSGLFVKNVTDEQLYLRMAYEVIDIDNGTFQICFPSTCNVQSKPGVYTTAAGRLDSGQEGNIQSEWYPESYGHCTVRFQIEQMEMTGTFPRQTWTKVADGPSVTVIFDYAAPTAIGAVKYVATQSQQTERIYDLQGCPAVHSSRVRGLLIERLPDGTIRKRVCR